MNTLEKANAAEVLFKAFSNACSELQLTQAEASRIIGVNPSTLSRNSGKGFNRFQAGGTAVAAYPPVSLVVCHSGW